MKIQDLNNSQNFYINDLETNDWIPASENTYEAWVRFQGTKPKNIELKITRKPNDKNDLTYKFELSSQEGYGLENRIQRRSSFHYLKETDVRLRDLQTMFRKTLLTEAVTVPEEPVKEEPKLEIVKEEPKQEKKQKPVQKILTIEDQIRLIVAEELSNNQEQIEGIENYLQNALKSVKVEAPTETIVVREYADTKINAGLTHFKFKQVLQALSVGVNTALVGPPSSFKTSTVIKVAKSLDLPFYSISCSSQTSTFDFFGYKDANGNYNPTDFRRAFENGGVYLVDEFDNSNPNVLASVNQASENEIVGFPDGMIQRHKDFIIVMAGNTYGTGATQDFIGRNKIDSATLDRFAFISFPYDEDMELQVASNKDWTKEVQKLRARADHKKMRVIISPRASIMGGKLLASGMGKEDVLKATVYKGMTEAQIELLKD